MKLWKTAYIALGIFLALASIFTATYGLSKKDRSIYERAVNLSGKLGQITFPNFNLENYTIRFYNGKNDYVMENGQIKKERPILNVFAGTVVKHDGKYEILLPTYDKMSSLIELIGTAGSFSEGDMTLTEGIYTEDAHIATMWHEAFHAWQFEHWEKDITNLWSESDITEEEDRESIILTKIDSNKDYVVLFTKEMEALQRAYTEINYEKKLEYIRQAITLEQEAIKVLDNSAKAVARYCQILEGSAMYVEASVYRTITSIEEFTKKYTYEFQYENGSGKYYRMGMYKCLLLDQLSQNWQQSLTMSYGPNELLEEVLRNR